MKLKATKKQIIQNSNSVLSIGYCLLETLLKYKNPFAYSAGKYGWSCDYYNINGVIISTGYSPIGKPAEYELVREYEKKAQELLYNNFNIDTEKKQDQLNELLNEFIKKAT